MSLRRRLALLSAAAVAVAVVLASVIVYALVSDSLRDQVDDDLRMQADRSAGRLTAVFSRAIEGEDDDPEDGLAGIVARVEAPPDGDPQAPQRVQIGPPPPEEPGELGVGAGEDVLALPPPEGGGGAPTLGQFISAEGEAIPTPGTPIRIPVSSSAREVAAGGGGPMIEDVDAGDTPLRVLTQPLADGAALQVAASMQNTEDTLHTLVVILFLVSAGGIALAAGLGPVVARTALAPAGEVSDAAEEVARTHDLTRRIEVRGDDELGRLAGSFNEMMAALERSEASQRRLVADASHELRTPLAVLRTNIETLGKGDRLAAAERDRLVQDVTDELEEMTALVSDVVELAREPGAGQIEQQDVRLDELARDAVERARRRARGLTFAEDLSPTVVTGDSQRLDRAISNLLDNAAKWSPAGGEVEISVEISGAGARVRVRDHGPGFAEEDLPKVFDRFWRSDEARGKHGSGLGLAIVQRVAEEHGGEATAANGGGGGAVVGFDLPGGSSPENTQDTS